MSDSLDGLQVLVSDIEKASQKFYEEGEKYRSQMPYDGTQVPFGCPRAGTELVDRILENTLRLIGEVHVQIGQAMENHGYRLKKAAEKYATAEDQARAGVYDVFQTAETTPLPPDEPSL